MNMESKAGILIQFIIPYLAVTIEAFVFCFAGEYLSTKVSTPLYSPLPGINIPLLILISSDRRKI